MSHFKPMKKSGSYRCSLNIVKDILIVASTRVKKTHIMYQANLSFVQVKKYLYGLLENDLLVHDGDSYYYVTEKGLNFLRLYAEYVFRYNTIEEQVERSNRERIFLESMYSNQHPVGGQRVARKGALSEAGGG